MEPEPSDAAREGASMLRLGWGASFTLGLITFILGVIITFRPSQSLTVIAVLLGIAMIASGIYHIARALDGRETERVWRGISGVLFILAGLVLLRHLHLTIALIGIFIGFSWIVQGVMALMEGFSGRGGAERGWSLLFGVISLIAGIIVISAPIATIGALTIFLGIWFIVMGLFEMLGSLLTRRAEHAWRKEAAEGVRVPGQRATTAPDATYQETAGPDPADDSRRSSREVPH